MKHQHQRRVDYDAAIPWTAYGFDVPLRQDTANEHGCHYATLERATPETCSTDDKHRSLRQMRLGMKSLTSIAGFVYTSNCRIHTGSICEFSDSVRCLLTRRHSIKPTYSEPLTRHTRIICDRSGSSLPSSPRFHSRSSYGPSDRLTEHSASWLYTSTKTSANTPTYIRCRIYTFVLAGYEIDLGTTNASLGC
jgi:hypothetical protein